MKRTWMIYVLSMTGLWAANNSREIEKQRAAASYGKLPLSFERNEGQADARVRFLARGRGYGLFLTRHEAVLSLAGQDKQQRAVLRVRLNHGSAGVADPVGVDALEGKSNYFVGNDPSHWRTGVSNYSAVKYKGVYPGIDLVYHGNQGQLEYDFDVAPGADPRRIELRFQGARKLRVNKAGDLLVNVGESELVEHRPVVYQEFEGKRELVAGSYVLRGRDRAGFRLDGYDRSRAVVIDPTLVYSTFLGGRSDDSASAIAVDATGNVYVTGTTQSADFPVTPGSFDTSFAYAFVTKLNATGSTLLFSTYLGSGGNDYGNAIAVDLTGNIYITGSTEEDFFGFADFPVTPGAFQTTRNGDVAGFVTKLNPTGSALLYSTFLGGGGGFFEPSQEGGYGIATDQAGNAYVTGYTTSADFPVTSGAFQTSFGGNDGSDAFVTKLNATGSALLYSTYLAGDSYDSGFGIAVDRAGNAYVAGSTVSPNFPVTPGAFQPFVGGGPYNAFVTKLNVTGSALIYSTYLNGSMSESEAAGIAIDTAGNAYVTGDTNSPNFPVTPGAFQTSLQGGRNAFVTKLNATGSALLYSTFLDGSAGYGDAGLSIAVDPTGNAYVVGRTSAVDFPVTPGAFQASYGGGFYDAFLTKLNSTGSALLYSTFLGGSGNQGDQANGIAIDGAGSAYVTGGTDSATFPVTPGSFQTSYGSEGYPLGGDAFVTKLDTTQSSPVITLLKVLPGPPRQIQLSSQDLQSGLASVQILKCDNCTAVTDSFVPGTKDPVITTATKMDQTLGSSVGIQATDLNGNSTIFDPTDITIQADGRAEVQLVRISGLEHVVMITNGTPGVRAVVLRVRGKDVPVLSLKDSETRTVDLAAELVAGRDNEVTVLSWGRRGAIASVVFTQP